jgi:Ca2+-transporting ATPase
MGKSSATERALRRFIPKKKRIVKTRNFPFTEKQKTFKDILTASAVLKSFIKMNQSLMVNVRQESLDSLNVPQARKENRQFLETMGGVEGLMTQLNTNATTGLSRADVLVMRERYGTNSFPESPMKGFFALFLEAFSDTTLLILIVAAIVSLAIGIWEHGAEEGWIEGGAILIAVFLVASVSAGNDYSKELQFRSLEKSSQSDERCSVVRDGVIERVNPSELVVGDLILLQV